MLVLNAIIGVVIVGRTVTVPRVGVTLPPGQMRTYAGSFLLLAIVAFRLASRLVRSIPDVTPPAPYRR
jgi:hypothetical protein